MDGLSSLEEIVLLAGQDLEGVGTEVITLGLDEVGGNDLGPVAVEEGESGRVGGNGNTPDGSLGNDSPPSGLGLGDGVLEAA